MKRNKETEQKKQAAGNYPDFEVRTDLAVEEQERFPGDGGEISGVSLRKWRECHSDIRMTEVKILDEHGAETMGKPVGTYLTLEADALAKKDKSYHEEVSAELSGHLRTLIRQMTGKRETERNILAVGLGNQDVTPDALGPKVLSNLQMTRHLQGEYGNEFCKKHNFPVLSGIAPGVMAQTGMETAEVLKGIIQETRPDFLIVVDALAARNTKRLNRTIQIADTGINPGSGVGNHRNAITEKTVGIPVIAIGVPTVVDAATIVGDTMDNLLSAVEVSESLKGMASVIKGYSPAEKYELIKELIAPHLNGMFVTPKDIDETVRRISYTISEALNMLFAASAT